MDPTDSHILTNDSVVILELRKRLSESLCVPDVQPITDKIRLEMARVHCNEMRRGSGTVRVIGIKKVRRDTRRHWETRTEVYILS